MLDFIGLEDVSRFTSGLCFEETIPEVFAWFGTVPRRREKEKFGDKPGSKQGSTLATKALRDEERNGAEEGSSEVE